LLVKLIYGLNKKMVHINIRRFGFSPGKNIFLVLVLANIKYFVLVLDILF